MLEVYGSEQNEARIIEQTKYIFDRLKEGGNPVEKLMEIFTKLGQTPYGDTKLSRIYRFIRLHESVDKAQTYHETLQKELKNMIEGEK